jgi:hypothetical protein
MAGTIDSLGELRSWLMKQGTLIPNPGEMKMVCLLQHRSNDSIELRKRRMFSKVRAAAVLPPPKC